MFAVNIPEHIAADGAKPVPGLYASKSSQLVYDIFETKYGSANHILIAPPL